MPTKQEHTFHETGARIVFEPTSHVIFCTYAKGPFDMTMLVREFGWGTTIIRQILHEVTEPVSILICAEHFVPRNKMPIRTGIKFIKLLRDRGITKMAFCCGDSSIHSVAAQVRILSGKQVRYFDTEKEAREWLATS